MMKESIFICCDCGMVSNSRPEKCLCGCRCFEENFKEDLGDDEL